VKFRARLKLNSVDGMKEGRLGRGGAKRLPSGAAVAFALPIILLYWQAGGPGGLLADPSTGVHVRTGQWIIAHHAIPRHDLFSYTLSSKSWCDWEWLSDVVFALAYRLHGLSSVVALSLVLLCLTSMVVYKTARRYAGPVVTGAVCALVMATTTIHWLARPHLFTWLGVAALGWALDVHTAERRAWLLPIAMAVWINLQPGFVAGLFVMSAWLAGAWFNERYTCANEERQHWRREIKWYAVALLLCCVLTLANPYFFQLDRHIASYLLAPSTVTAHVSEWLSPDFHNPRLAWFELLLPIAASAGIWHAFRRRFHWCLLTFGFMHLALSSVRNVPLFAIVCAAPVAAAIEEALRKLDFRRYVREAEGVAKSGRRARITLALWGIGFAAILAVAVSPVWPGAGSRIPVAAIRRLPPGRLFTTDQWADYLIYAEPDRKVFFDSRNDFYGLRFVRLYLTIITAKRAWRQALNRYGITVVLVPTPSPISTVLRYTPGWQKLYCAGDAVVFVRQIPSLAGLALLGRQTSGSNVHK
jgi:hypothetical protein